MNGAQLLIEVMKRQQVDAVFGYPGGAIMPVYDALYESGLKHYLCRHEQGAAFAASGYAKATGKVGVCMATSGPGMTNLITGLADAQADSVPVVAITGQVATTLMGTDAFQEVDVLGLALPITKHAYQVRKIEELQSILERAFHIAREGRPGVVLVDIPKDIQLADTSIKPQLIDKPQRQTASSEQIAVANQLLSSSEKPILYVGGGVGNANAQQALRDFIRRTGIPSVSTLKGLGAISRACQGYLGMLGMHGSKAANLAVQACDCLISVGARFDDRVTGKLEAFAPDAKVIHLDIDPAECNKLRPAQVSLLGDLSEHLKHLNTTRDIRAWRSWCDELHKTHAYRYAEGAASAPIEPPLVLRELSEKVSQQFATSDEPQCFITTDVGQHQMWTAQHMQFDHPRQFLTSGGLGSMGYGLPAAIGAQIARPQAQVISITGDGSFMMNIQELATIKRFSLPIKILLFDNTKLGMVRQWQRLFFDKRFSETDLSDNPEFTQLAEAFDIPAEKISDPLQVSDALERLLQAEGPRLLHVCIHQDQNVWPLVPPNTANHAMLEGETK